MPVLNFVHVYLAGPYTLDPERFVAESKEWARRLIAAGFVPYHAHLSHYHHLTHPEPYETWIGLDLAWIERCDCLLRFSTEPSPGADQEEAWARRLGKPVFVGERGFSKLVATYGRPPASNTRRSRGWTRMPHH